MLEALQTLRDNYSFSIEVIDVDADDSLVALYDELVPVLVAKKDKTKPVQLCHYFLDEIKVKAFLLEDRAGQG